MRSIVTTAGVVIALLGLGPRADAAPITYSISATASGNIGGTGFSNALVTLVGQGNTANVVQLYGGVLYANPLASLVVTISGVGTATVTEPTEIVAFPAPIADPRLPALPMVILGRTDLPPALDSFTGIGAVASNALGGYGLTTAIGPISDLGGVGFPTCGIPGRDPCIQTTSGALSFTSNEIFAEGATFTATLQPVPEPATAALLAGGLAALVRRSRRRSRG